MLNIPPQAMQMGTNTELGPETFEEQKRKTLGEEVRQLKRGRDKMSGEFPTRDEFIDEMIVNVYVFHPFVSNKILVEENCTVVIRK